MTSTQQLREQLADYNEVGQLYLAVGLGAVFVGWFFVPIVSVVAIYCGIKLITEDHSRIVGGILVGMGLFGVMLLVLEIAGVSDQ